MKELKNLELAAFQLAQSQHSSDLLLDIRALWTALTQERSSSIRDYLRKPALRRAYLGYYMPLYARKIASLLQRIFPKRPFHKPHVLDLGAGPLSALLGLYFAWGDFEEAVAVDREIGPMHSGLEFIEGFLKQKWPIKFCSANLKGPSSLWKPGFKADVILMAHVLNELGLGQRFLGAKLRLIQQALGCLSPQGILIIVEPASKACSQDLMRLRNLLFRDQQVQIIAPCPENVLRCPLLLEPSSWCHADLEAERSVELKRIDQKIGFGREFLKCSYLVLARDSAEYTACEQRIVSGPMQSKGILRRYACTPRGLLTYSQKMEDKTLILDSLLRGEAISYELLAKNLVKISKES